MLYIGRVRLIRYRVVPEIAPDKLVNEVIAKLAYVLVSV